MADFDEGKHKRDDGGKFTSGGGGGAVTDDTKKAAADIDAPIEIKGDELGPYKDTKELREKAGQYYQDHLANTSVEHPDLGEIKFSEGGWKKPKSFSADPDKLKVVPLLKPIISQGRIVEEGKDKKERPNVDSWHHLEKNVSLGGKPTKVRVTIRKDNNGKLYYDHVIAKPLGLVSGSANPGVTRQGVENSVSQPEYEINIRFVGEDGEATVNRITNQYPDDKPFNQRIKNWRVDEDGMLRVTAHILREGVYNYAPHECPPSFGDLPVIKQYIPAAGFTHEALTSLEGKWVVVSAHEWRTDETTMTDGLTVGSVAGAPRLSEDGKAIECDMLIADKDTIADIESGRLVEVSAAYSSNLKKTSGEFDGVHFDAMQQGFNFNHVLLLPAGQGRCGSKVRIINRLSAKAGKTNNEGTMASTFKVRIGNSDRTLRFSNEEDAAVAESALEEEKKFNAEALAEHIAARGEVQAKLDEVNKQMAELQTQLAEHDKHLADAKAEIERLLTPEAQEQLAKDLNTQKDDEESIVEVEAENASEEEKEKILNSIRSGKTLAERRVNAAKWHFENRKLEAPPDATQSYFDGLFVGLAAGAKEKILNSEQRVLNGKMPKKTRTVNSREERVMKSCYPTRKEA